MEKVKKIGKHDSDLLKGIDRRRSTVTLINNAFVKNKMGLFFKPIQESVMFKSLSEKKKDNKDFNYTRTMPDGEGMALHYVLQNKHCNRRIGFIFMYRTSNDFHLKVPSNQVSNNANDYLKMLVSNHYYVLIVHIVEGEEERYSIPIPVTTIMAWDHWFPKSKSNRTRLVFKVPFKKIYCSFLDGVRNPLLGDSTVLESLDNLFK